MVKLYPIILAALLIAIQQQETKAFLPVLIGYASSISGFVQFGLEYYEKVNRIPEGNDGSLGTLKKLNRDAVSDMGEIIDILSDLPSMLHHIDMKTTLNSRVSSISAILEEALTKLSNIKKHKPDDRKELKNFAEQNDKKLDDDLATIQQILLLDNTVNFLGHNYTTNIAKYEPVCKTGLSHMQVLDKLLVTLRFVTIQYYAAKNKIFDIFEYLDNAEHSFNTTRENLFQKVKREYRYAVIKFKEIMIESSQDLYKCDSLQYKYEDDDPHWNNFSENFPYYRLIGFQKYFVNEDAANDRKQHQSKDKTCPQIKYLHNCIGHDEQKLCARTRKCSGELIGCHAFQDLGKSSFLCLVPPGHVPNTMARYTTMVREESKFHCPSKDNVVTMYTPSSHPPGGYRYPLRGYFSKFCECICEETSYYISLQPVMASKNKVITGAKLTVDLGRSTIHIKIQEAELLPDAIINNQTFAWKSNKIDESNRVKIDWNSFKEIDLTDVTVPDNHVLVGLELAKRENLNRVYLRVHARHINVKLGKIDNNNVETYDSKPGENKLDLSNSDINHRSGRRNFVNYNNSQFLEFTTSSLELDAGQSTVPFIDIQGVTSNRPTPMSGAGLIHRGHPGFGGFLAIKLLTFNIVPHITDDIDLEGPPEIISQCS